MVELIQFIISNMNSCLITIGKTVKLLCPRIRSRLMFLASTTLSTIAKQLFMLCSNSRILKLRTGFSQGLPRRIKSPIKTFWRKIKTFWILVNPKSKREILWCTCTPIIISAHLSDVRWVNPLVPSPSPFEILWSTVWNVSTVCWSFWTSDSFTNLSSSAILSALSTC